MMNVNSPTHEILVLIAYTLNPGLNTPACEACGARALYISLFLHLCPECVCIRAAKALASLRICAYSPALSLLNKAISTKISCSGSDLITV